jgi:endonuclease YncB( thermonuclease family)
MFRPLLVVALGALVALASGPAAIAGSNEIAGRATVIDGDTIELGSTRIRLFGIDAVEAAQTCTTDGRVWPCGQYATGRMKALTGTRAIVCEPRDNDDYGRTVALCRADGIDIAAAMVEDGWATALPHFTAQYVALESLAKAGQKGIWNSSFDLPSAYRAAIAPVPPRQAKSVTPPRATPTRPTRAEYASRACAIKGNHSRRGEWIYHLPGTKYYDVTRAEQFFCSEAQARAAGYRRARNN